MSRYGRVDFDDMAYELDEFLEDHPAAELLRLVTDAIDWYEEKKIDENSVEHGTWIFSPDHAEGICSRCNFKIYGRPYNNTYMIVPYNYCPNCGAKMDEKEE